MKNITTHHGTLRIIKRLPQSVNGNARFQVYVGGFHCVTPVDSDLADYVKNWEGKNVVATIGTHYGVATLNTLERASE